ncbi:MAG: zf-HC2 domain-containing protein [Candidatus Krumholzibacteriia bacterium]
MSDRTTERDGCACDLLAAYELGLLDPDERRDFENHLAGCPDCQEEIYAHAPAALALQEDPGRFARAAQPAMAATRDGLRERLSGWLTGRWPRILVPAALVAVAALVVVLPAVRQGSDLADLAVVDPLPYARIEMRAGAEEPVRLFHEGMDSYIGGAYGLAADRLSHAAQVQEAWPAEAGPLPAGLLDQTRIYLGVSLLLDGRAGSALDPLTRASDSPLPPLAERARWYLAQACLLTDRVEAAREALVPLVTSPVFGARAQTLLDAMGS